MASQAVLENLQCLCGLIREREDLSSEGGEAECLQRFRRRTRLQRGEGFEETKRNLTLPNGEVFCRKQLLPAPFQRQKGPVRRAVRRQLARFCRALAEKGISVTDAVEREKETYRCLGWEEAETLEDSV